MNDLGMRNVLLNYFAAPTIRTDRGELFESYVFRQLTDYYPTAQLKYWRTADGNEVDFIIDEKPKRGRAVDVKFTTNLIRPTRYQKFTDAYPQFPLQFVTYDELEAGL